MNKWFDEGYGIVPKKLMKSKISIYSKGIMCYFLSFTGAGKLTCWPTIETISNDLEIGQSTVKRCIKELVECGMIEKTKHFTNDPLRRNNEYRLIILESSEDAKSFIETLHSTTDNLSTVHLDTLLDSQRDANNITKNNINKNNNKRIKNEFIPPTLDEVKQYFEEEGYREDIAIEAYEYYKAGDWKDSYDKPVKRWKQKMRIWMKPKNKIVSNIQPTKPTIVKYSREYSVLVLNDERRRAGLPEAVEGVDYIKGW